MEDIRRSMERTTPFLLVGSLSFFLFLAHIIYSMSSPPLPPPLSSDQSLDRISSQQQQQQQQQKKQRTLHSSIEKRRRERINDKIQQLKEMIPACNPYSEKNPIAGPSLYQPLHKLTILQAAIEYIEEMHQKLLDASTTSSSDTTSHLLDDPKIVQVIEHAQQCTSGSYRKILE